MLCSKPYWFVTLEQKVQIISKGDNPETVYFEILPMELWNASIAEYVDNKYKEVMANER